jgi:hypothetical protein
MTGINKAIEGPENSGKLVRSDSVCIWCKNKRERERERRITQESYPGSPKPATSSPHTSCEIIHYSIQLVETSNQHYKVLITPDQSSTLVLSTSAGFYNS